jgi:hypothetical protein
MYVAKNLGAQMPYSTINRVGGKKTDTDFLPPKSRTRKILASSIIFKWGKEPNISCFFRPGRLCFFSLLEVKKSGFGCFSRPPCIAEIGALFFWV